MSSRRTDFRALRARRDAALERPELMRAPKPTAPDPRSIAAAIAAGKFTKVPPGMRKIR